VLEAMKERGIPTVVWLTPVLPFINDTEENIAAILEACAQARVKGIVCFDMGLTLREGDREYYYAALDAHFPGLKEKYIRTYGNAYEVPSPHREQLMELFRSFCRNHGMLCDPEECFDYLNMFPEKFRQMTFLDG
jgi:DNA repair photolyase